MKRILASVLSMVVATTACAETTDVVGKQLDLGIQLLKHDSKTSNPVLSPFSVHAGLALARLGARGATAGELDRLLFGAPLDAAGNERYARLCAEVASSSSQGVSTALANSVWVSDRAEVNPEFLSKAKLLRSEARSIDFSDAERARATINAWVSEKTSALIPELIQAGQISSRTTAALVSALHFKGDWLQRFSKRATRAEPFHVHGAPTTENVPMMFSSGALPYHESSGWQSVLLMYASERHALLLLVPTRNLTTRQVIDSLSPDVFQGALASRSESQVDLTVPRFELRQSQDLVESLSALGLSAVFSPQADFSALSNVPTVISAVPHEALVSVDEEGTEAAAATAVMGVLSKAAQGDGPKTVKADHPFAFAIIHLESKAPLFIGVVGDPRG